MIFFIYSYIISLLLKDIKSLFIVLNFFTNINKAHMFSQIVRKNTNTHSFDKVLKNTKYKT